MSEDWFRAAVGDPDMDRKQTPTPSGEFNKSTERLTRELDEYPVTVDSKGRRTVVIPSELFDRTLDALRTMPSETAAPSFDMMAELKKRLADDGWTVNEAAPSDDKKGDDVLMAIAHIVMGFENEDPATHYQMLSEIRDVIASAPQSAVAARIECVNCGTKYERYEAPCPHCTGVRASSSTRSAK